MQTVEDSFFILIPNPYIRRPKENLDENSGHVKVVQFDSNFSLAQRFPSIFIPRAGYS